VGEGRRQFNGVHHFTFDSQQLLQQHQENINRIPLARATESQPSRRLPLNVNPRCVDTLFNMLKEINIYAKALRLCNGIVTNSTAPETTMRLVAKFDEAIHDLSVTLFKSSTGGTKLKFRHNNSITTQEVDAKSPQTEALLYPLLRPYGELGWDYGLTRNGLSLQQYVTSMLLMPETTDVVIDHIPFGYDRTSGMSTDPTLLVLKQSNIDQTHLIATNRFQLSSRLKQYWLVETFSRYAIVI
jgi:hypothetical protein